MHICLLCMEIFAWGKYGGFGRATRTIGSALTKRGIKITAIVPRRITQKPEEILDGFRVLSFPLYNQVQAFQLYQQVNADIYHSQEPSLNTWVAQKARPHAKHIITFRDTRLAADWDIETSLPTHSSFRVAINRWYEDGPLVHAAVHAADGLFAASHIVQQKAFSHYQLPRNPVFLPTPVKVPPRVIKAKEPTVCFVARMDRRKRPELFFELAEHFPQVKFIAAGKAHDPEYNLLLQERASRIPNLEWKGFIDQFDRNALGELLSKSWIMVNTAQREGLPNAFIEAAAHRCAILSTVDPDSFSTRFGYFSESSSLADGLHWLLEDNRWKEKGEAGWSYVKNSFDTDKAIDRHLQIYEEVLGSD